MHISRRTRVAVAAACALGLVPASLARAAAPTTVTVRVEGATQTLVPATTVTTTTTPIVKDGKAEDACPGTNAIGALDAASDGNWSGQWFGGEIKGEKFVGLGYSLETILGESHAFGSGAFWDFWPNHREATQGMCEAELEPGEELLFFPCPESAKECLPLAIEAPHAANAGESFLVSVTRYSTTGAAAPVAGATVAAEGVQATTNENGHATVAISRTGQVTVTASAPEMTRAETTVCVHNGDDGTCGTQASVQSPNTLPNESGQTHVAPYRGPFAVVSRFTNLIDGHVYPRRHAPRLLEGVVSAHTAVASVSIELHRSFRGRCWAYDGAAAQFKRARCGRGRFFVVGHEARFSYLLPAALPPGRYVLDVDASDAVGNRTTRARGTSRIVFYVRR